MKIQSDLVNILTDTMVIQLVNGLITCKFSTGVRLDVYKDVRNPVEDRAIQCQSIKHQLRKDLEGQV